MNLQKKWIDVNRKYAEVWQTSIRWAIHLMIEMTGKILMINLKSTLAKNQEREVKLIFNFYKKNSIISIFNFSTGANIEKK